MLASPVVIPDIAFMIVVYGCARLGVAALEPHRHGNSDWAKIATGLSWLAAIGAGIGLLYLGYDVYHLASSTTGTAGLT